MRFVSPLTLSLLLAILPLQLAPAPASAQSQDVVIGVNLVNEPYKQTAAELETTLRQLNDAGVQAIRCGIPDSEQGINFAQKVHEHGIKILWLIHPWPEKGTPWPKPPEECKGFWKDYPLSKADPQLSGSQFAALLAKLESTQVELVGIEVGNELNWAGFNADFSLPAPGRVLKKADLQTDPEGKAVAAGYLKYVQVLAAIKEVRDHSKQNQHTPIISAGLADCGGAQTWLAHVKADVVSIPATLDFLREHGLDKLVDGYGIHCYPHMAHNAGSPEAAAKVQSHLQLNGIDECQPASFKQGKPCWLTEWGVDDKDEPNRCAQASDIRSYLKRLAQKNRLKGMFFYTWQGNIHAPKEDGASAFRAGKLTDAGRMAIAPL